MSDAVWLLLFLVAVAGQVVWFAHTTGTLDLSEMLVDSGWVPRSDPPPALTVPSRLKGAARRLQILANNFSRGRVVDDDPPRAEGGFRGRIARVAAGEESVGEIYYALDMESDLRLDVLRRATGSSEYFASFSGETPAQQAAAGQLLTDPAVQRALGTLFTDLDCESVVLAGGHVQVTRLGIDLDLVPSRVERVLREMLRLAKAAEEVPSVETLASIEASPAGVDLEGRQCPYCKDELHTAQVVSCKDCRTVLHAECFAELGKCPTLGCGGRLGLPLVGGSRRRITLDLSVCSRCGSRLRGCTESHCRGTRRERERHRQGLRRRTAESVRRRLGRYLA